MHPGGTGSGSPHEEKRVGQGGGTCLRNMGESSSLVKAAMSVLVSRGGEAAAALSKKLEEIWAGGRREEEGGGGRA